MRTLRSPDGARQLDCGKKLARRLRSQGWHDIVRERPSPHAMARPWIRKSRWVARVYRAVTIFAMVVAALWIVRAL